MSIVALPEPKILTFDFTPEPLWGHSPALLVGLDRWQPVRADLLEMAGGICRACHRATAITDHAVWQYEDNLPDDYTGVRTLLGFEVLCGPCMAVRHPALRRKFGVSSKQMIDHYCAINRCDLKQFVRDYGAAAHANIDRSLVEWREDVSLLVRMGLLDPDVAAQVYFR